jgi:hypothetical protein
MELNLHTCHRWTLAKVEMDFRMGKKADIAHMNKFLSSLVIGLPTEDYSSGNQEAKPIEKGNFGMLKNSWEIDAGAIAMKLRLDPALLLDKDRLLRAFQSG